MQCKRNVRFLRNVTKQVVTICRPQRRFAAHRPGRIPRSATCAANGAERFVNRLVVLGGILLLVLAHAAWAQHGPRGGRFAPAGPRPAQKQVSAQEANLRVPGNGGERRGGPMTSEERQQLRRDINEHGREIYREGKAPTQR